MVGLGCCPGSWRVQSARGDSQVPPGLCSAGPSGLTERSRLPGKTDPGPHPDPPAKQRLGNYGQLPSALRASVSSYVRGSKRLLGGT